MARKRSRILDLPESEELGQESSEDGTDSNAKVADYKCQPWETAVVKMEKREVTY